MSPRPEATLNIHDISRLFSKYCWFILLCTLCSAVLFTFAAHKLPKKYKAHFVLAIYSKYYQSPLIGDFVPGMGDWGGMRSQTESLIRQALTPDYLDALGMKYGIYPFGQTPSAPLSRYQTLRTRLKLLLVKYGLYEPGDQLSQLSEERQALRERIEIFSLNNTTFHVSFIYSEPRITYEVSQDIYNQVIQSLLEVRSHTLGNIRDAIRNRVATLPVPSAPEAAAPTAPIASSPDDKQLPIQEELKQVRSQIRALMAQYTEEHPLVQQLRDRERTLVRRQKDSAPESIKHFAASGNVTRANGTSDLNRDIYGDLNKKLNYLNIAMDSDKLHQTDYFAALETPLYPASPLWPKTPLFVFWGLSLGFLGSLFMSALREYFDRSALHTNALAHQLNIPVLGELPSFPSKAPR